MTVSTTRAHLDAAARIAQRAGEYLRGAAQVGRAIASEARRDVKIAADTAAEALICGALETETHLPILSEERGATAGASAASLRWIVDPLDGTFNFLRGIPWCAVSIGLWNGDDALAGVVYDFWRDELFSGIVGEGAHLNGAPIAVSPLAPRERSVLCTGLPAAADFSGDAVASLVAQLRTYKKCRLLGSASISLAYVAAGRVDAYYEPNIRLWDVAAGVALVRAAGGSISVERAGADILTLRAANSPSTWPD